MALTTVAADIYRDFDLDGVPSSGPHNPKKPDIRRLLGGYEQVINAFTSNGGLVYDSRAMLFADLAKDANRMAWVVGDDTAANNGVYRKVGASGGGSWSRVADLPYSFIVATDVGDGTPNAIKATSVLPISGSALVLLNIYETSAGTPVTVSFNDGAPLTIKTNSGNDIVPGGLLAGMLVMGRSSGSTFRLVSDQVSTAIVAEAEALLVQMQSVLSSAVDDLTEQTEAIRDQAQSFANASASSATEAGMYAEMVGAAVYDFNFDTDPETPETDWNI